MTNNSFFHGWLELRNLPRRVWLICAAAFINRMGTMALPFMTLYLTSALGWPAPRAAAILGLYGAVSLAAVPVAGRLADRWGADRVMKVCLTASGAMMLLFPFATSLPAVAAMTVVWAVFGEGFRPANIAAITESASEGQRKQAYALHRAAINLGMSVGPAAGGVIATLSYPWLWRADALTSLVSAAILWRGLHSLPAAGPAEKEGGSKVRALTDRRLAWFLGAMILQSLVFFQHESSLPLHLARSLGTSPTFYGFLFTVNTVLIVLIEIPLNHAMALWPHRRTLALGAFLIAAGFGCYGFATRAWVAVAATVIWTFGEMVLMPGATAYVAAIAPASRRGEYMGIYVMSFNVGFMLGPWLGVSAMEHWGAPALWGLCFLVGVVSMGLFARVERV